MSERHLSAAKNKGQRVDLRIVAVLQAMLATESDQFVPPFLTPSPHHLLIYYTPDGIYVPHEPNQRGLDNKVAHGLSTVLRQKLFPDPAALRADIMPTAEGEKLHEEAAAAEEVRQRQEVHYAFLASVADQSNAFNEAGGLSTDEAAAAAHAKRVLEMAFSSVDIPKPTV